MDLQDAIKKAIQAYMDGEDVQPDGRKYTKSYLDKFHEERAGAKLAAKSDKKVTKELEKADVKGAK
jgi:hypothetical protein